MENPRRPLFLFTLSLWLVLPTGYGGGGVEAERSLHHHHHRHSHRHRAHFHGKSALSTSSPSKLFVFGDSYVDTGNEQGNSWKDPYGITFPGKPAGRFSDGRVLTDLLANYLRLESPVAYRLRNASSPQSTKYGVNFATGGTGVFDTLSSGPNVSTQIDQFHGLLGQAYSPAELKSSAALVTISGNDYGAYLAKNGSILALPTFIIQVVNQLTADIKRIHELGVRRVLVSNLAPLGCLPAVTAGSGQCIGTLNALVTFHNQLLQQAVQGLNGNFPPPTNFTLLDLYSSFSSALNATGKPMLEDPLKPCCAGTSLKYSCGSVDSKTGERQYSVCPNRESAFFWDLYHPTQAGWNAVFSNLTNTINQQLRDHSSAAP